MEVYSELRYAIEYNPTGRDYSNITRILAEHVGEPDGEDWVWLVEFDDESRGCYIGGCDYTGWDCRSSLQLLPFDGWQDEVRKHRYDSFYRDVSTNESVIAELTAQLTAAV